MSKLALGSVHIRGRLEGMALRRSQTTRRLGPQGPVDLGVPGRTSSCSPGLLTSVLGRIGPEGCIGLHFLGVRPRTL